LRVFNNSKERKKEITEEVMEKLDK